MRRMPFILIAGMLWCGVYTYAQDENSDNNSNLEHYFTFEDPHPLECLFTLLPPVFIQNGIELKSFVRSKTFRLLRQQYGDRRAVDAIFVRAMQMTNNNTAFSLLMSALATFDHDIVGIKIPLLLVYVPLSSETREEFFARVDNLPARFYNDSPQRKEGDRDKLQHFFGSAVVTFFFESPQAAERVGEFVEHGEDAFIVGGVLDERDYRANEQGQKFGAALLDDNRRFPSEFLVSPPVAEVLDVKYVPFCSGVW